MFVYTVEKGEFGEGSKVLGIFKSKKKAKEYALSVKTSFGGGWQETREVEDMWENGCDYVCVEKVEVQE